VTRFRAAYGASPLHLLAAIAAFAIAGYAFFRIAEAPSALGTFAWFAAAIVLHDVLAFPLYSALNLVAGRAVLGGGEEPSPGRVSALNHLRIPAVLSGFALLLFFPEILGLDSTDYMRDTGLSGDVFLGRWLGLTGALFAGSALLYAVRLRRARGGAEDAEPEAGEG
jgi:hypothetical protein